MITVLFVLKNELIGMFGLCWLKFCYKAQADACASEFFLIMRDDVQPCAIMGGRLRQRIFFNYER